MGAQASKLPEYSLANISESEESLASLLKPPVPLPREDEHVKCEGYVKKNGKFSKFYCYLRDGEVTAFEKEVLEKLLIARAVPARINSKPRTIWLQFSAHLSSIDGSIRVTHDVLSKPYPKEIEYRAPQRYVDPKRCRMNSANPVLVNYRVTNEGKIDNIGFKVHTEETIYTKRVAKCFKGTKYLPAQRKGLAVESIVIEPVFNRFRAKIVRGNR